jgi:hypothetical protein
VPLELYVMPRYCFDLRDGDDLAVEPRCRYIAFSTRQK